MNYFLNCWHVHFIYWSWHTSCFVLIQSKSSGIPTEIACDNTNPDLFWHQKYNWHFCKVFFSFRSYFFCCCLLTGCWDYEQTRQNWICIIFHLELLASLIISLLHIYEMKTHCPFLDVYRYLYKIWDFGLFRLRIFLPSHFPTSLLKFPFFFHSAIFFSHIESAFFYFFHLFILLGIICGNRS